MSNIARYRLLTREKVPVRNLTISTGRERYQNQSLLESNYRSRNKGNQFLDKFALSVQFCVLLRRMHNIHLLKQSMHLITAWLII